MSAWTALSGHAITPLACLLALIIATFLIVRDVVRSRLRERREKQALTLAPRIYEAGGDPADVLRAVTAPPD